MTRAEIVTKIHGTHWLIIDHGTREIVGCHCGFRSELDASCGYGDDVLDHIVDAALLEAGVA